MKIVWALLISSAGLVVARTPTKRFYHTHAYYAIEYTQDSEISLAQVADALGVEVVEQAGELRDVFLVRVPHAELEARNLAIGLDTDPVIHAFDVLVLKASSFMSARSDEEIFAKRLVSSVKFLERQTPRSLTKRAPPPIGDLPYNSALGVARRLGIKDPLFTDQWHLVNDDYPEHMMNTTPVWDIGITGKGVHTSFLDDGLDFEHDDLKDAFDAENSYDFNEHHALPRPVADDDDHGTRCAGQVVAQRNDVCGVGIAYDAKAAGIRMLGGKITYADEASALNYGFQQVSLYSCSWGPRDDGRRMQGPGYLVRKAVVNGINEGRDGKGSIFVFASGNGGDFQDQCNFDGYTNSIYSVTVSAVDYKGLHPSYSEECTANMIVAYTSGSGKHITTTDRGIRHNNKCTHGHSGTSAAAPNAVGVFALALQARPELTWRDIQHLCVETARIVSPEDNSWERTATGRFYSNKFGYGALDAYAYVKAAQTWDLVKPQAWLHTETVQIRGGKTHSGRDEDDYIYEGGERIASHGFESVMTITKEMLDSNNLESLEHIDIRVWISHSRRGDVEVELVSPNGITSVLARKRRLDDAQTGFPGWRFMTVKHWGENPVGDWALRVFDQNDDRESGKVLGWNMVLWGSSIDPLKATKYVEPVVTDILPPPPAPHRPIVDDPASTSSIQYAKPTDHLPPSHLPPTQGDAPDSGGDKQPPPPSIEDGDPSMMKSSQKWFFMSIGAFLGLMAALGLYLWRRRVARTRLNEYTSLATADDIRMDTVVDSPAQNGPRSGRNLPELHRLSLDSLGEHPLIESSGARKERIHTPFLDDDEMSPLTFRPGPGERPSHPLSLAEVSHSVNRSLEQVDENSPWFVVK